MPKTVKARVMPKPVMRNMLINQTKTQLMVVAGIMFTTYTALRFLWYEPLKRKYCEWYTKTDMEALAEEMSELGYFQSKEAASRVDPAEVMRKVKGKDECAALRKLAARTK